MKEPKVVSQKYLRSKRARLAALIRERKKSKLIETSAPDPESISSLVGDFNPQRIIGTPKSNPVFSYSKQIFDAFNLADHEKLEAFVKKYCTG